jgi:DNA-binding CsgD family transcriptional regulator
MDLRAHFANRHREDFCDADRIYEAMMDDSEELTKLVGVIYDAALDPRLWTAALEGCAQFANGAGAALFSKDANSKNGDMFYETGGSAHYRQLYFDKYIHLDPFTTGQFFASIDVPISTLELVSDDDYLESRFYKEWVQPQGIADCLTTVLDRSDTSAAMLGIFRDEGRGFADDEMRRRVRLIAPHVRRSVMIGRAIDLSRSETETFANVLDGLAASVIFVTPNCRITHTNKSARLMLAAANLLLVNRDRLASVDLDSNRALIDAIAATSNGDAAMEASGISMPLKSRDGDDYVVHVLPLTSGHRREASVSYSASAAIFVHKPNRKTVTAPEAITKAYGLTPGELRVFLAIVEVGGAPEAAEALGISVNTVKSHLQRIFSKTGADRQADLAKLLSGFASPFNE